MSEVNSQAIQKRDFLPRYEWNIVSWFSPYYLFYIFEFLPTWYRGGIRKYILQSIVHQSYFINGLSINNY